MKPTTAPSLAPVGFQFTDADIAATVDAWLADAATTEAQYGHPSTWDVSLVTNFRNLFRVGAGYRATAFNADISGWDTSSATRMNEMFSGNDAFDWDIGDWDVSNVEWCIGVFRNAASFNQDLSRWDLSQCKNTNGMFVGATSFNQDLSAWDVYNWPTTNLEWMFAFTAMDQDLGWRLRDDVSFTNIAVNAPCEATNCGVAYLLAPSPVPTAKQSPTVDDDGAVSHASITGFGLGLMIVVGVVALLSFVGYTLVRRARRSSTDAARMSCDVELKHAYGERESAFGSENPLPRASV